MADRSYLEWPFFEPRHRELALALDAWAGAHVPHGHGADGNEDCRALVRALGRDGWLRHAAAGAAHGGAGEVIDTRAVCLIRETLARHSGLADFAFAMQGLGSGAISLHGTPGQRARYLAPVAAGEAIAAFALLLTLLVYTTGNLGAAFGAHLGNNLTGFLLISHQEGYNAFALFIAKPLEGPGWTTTDAAIVALIGIGCTLLTILMLLHPRSPLKVTPERADLVAGTVS